MVISDPTQGDECVIVNFTSWRADKDQACVVEEGEHPYVRHKTLVNFREAKRLPIRALEALIASKHLQSHEPLSPQLLAKIRAVVPQSLTNWECVQLLDDQSLIDLT
jgi:hypothetical protein